MKQVPEGATIIVGVSAGADSMTLWHVLHHQGYRVIACYINHHQRPEENKHEIATIKQTADNWQSECVIEEISWQELQVQTGNFQQFAREKRYNILQRVAKEYETPYIALAHHSDDLVETVLMRLTRGTSPQGIVPFKAYEQRKNYTLLRPLYDWTKATIYEYCEKEKIVYCKDSSNDKLCYTRNRYRNQIIPLLQQENHHLSKHVRQFVMQLEQIDDYLEEQAQQIVEECFKQYTKYVCVSINILKNKPIALQSAVFKIILRYVYPNEDLYLRESVMTTLLAFCQKTTGSEQFIWQQHIFERNYTTIYIYRLNTANIAPNSQSLAAFQPHFGEYTIVHSNQLHKQTLCQLPYPQTELEYINIRCAEATDRIQFKNGQHKKVSRVFIDHKIPRFLRTSWPIVTYHNQIIWIYGLWQCIPSTWEGVCDCTMMIKEESAL